MALNDESPFENGSLEVNSLESGATNQPYPTPQPKSPLGTLRHKLKWRLVVLSLLALFLIAGIILGITSITTKKTNKTIVINTQSLGNGTLNKITSQINGKGATSTQLTISLNTLFENNVSVQGTLNNNGDLNVGGNFSVKGTSSLLGSLSTNGNLAVKGSGNIAGNLSVSGLISATSLSVGSITISTINLSGDMNISGHIIPAGPSPAVAASTAASGGTVSISGNDTAGTVTIVEGNAGNKLAGELAIITFHKPFATTPKVQLTPVNAASAQLNYYVSQSPTFFTIECASVPVSGATYTFNYLVTQ